MVWSEADSLSVMFVDSAILNDPRFRYLQLCDNNWKLKYWISKNYPSWVKNHLVTLGIMKAKKEILNDKNLVKITPDASDPETLPDIAMDLSNAIPHEDIMVLFFCFLMAWAKMA
jgi:DNA-directed RNA polymerase delta subunit